MCVHVRVSVLHMFVCVRVCVCVCECLYVCARARVCVCLFMPASDLGALNGNDVSSQNRPESVARLNAPGKHFPSLQRFDLLNLNCSYRQ
jgi:hypothetical protein